VKPVKKKKRIIQDVRNISENLLAPCRYQCESETRKLGCIVRDDGIENAASSGHCILILVLQQT
jgi:hypothetical protein